MIKNYLKVAFRNILRHKVYSLINIFGLAIGMALCLLILVYVQDELSCDGFHEKADRIYRIAQTEDHNGDLINVMRTAPGVTTRLEIDFPEAIEKTVRIFPAGEVWTKYEDRLFREDKVYVVDDSFFDIFTFDFISGNPETALKEPNSIVLNRTSAEKYFGETDTLGNFIEVDMPGAPLLKVTAVVENMPGNSHFHPDFLVSLSTIRNEQNAPLFDRMGGNVVWSYLLLKEEYSAIDLESNLNGFWDKHLNETQKKLVKKYYLLALTDIHLRSSTDPYTEIEPENTGNITYLYIFSVIAVLVLLVACINFMNLATARSARRAREVGLRKVVGAFKQQLVRQFIGESMFMGVLALPAAIGLAHLFLPVFNSLAGKEMVITYFTSPILIPAMVMIVLFVGFVAGSYPAFFLSSFQPVNVLKGELKTSGSGSLFRKILVTGQFAVSVGFVIGILIISQQMNFMRSINLGFNKDNVLVLSFILPESPQQRLSKMEVLKNEYLSHPGITDVAMTSGAPSEIRGIVRGRVDGTPANEAKLMVRVPVDYEFCKTLQIELMEGRDFSREHGTDLMQAFIINEAVVQELELESPLGKQLVLNNQKGTVIGVMKSMHWEPKRRVIFPMVFQVNPQAFFKMVVRINADDIPATLAFMEEKWKANITSRPFQYQFLDDLIDNLYKSERRLSNVVFNFTLLSIFVACLGLFGLASYTMEQKTKEIGIRKVLGASVFGVVLLLFKQFGKLILIANIVAWPLTYYWLHKWLQNFFYRISIGLEIFALSSVLVLVIAFLSISYQSIKAAISNPADALRHE
jgi:putative ABC transport system permease protein